MTVVDTQYEDLLWEVLNRGAKKGDRTGTGTRSSFGERLVYDLSQSLPVITTKKVHLKSVIHELLWFLRGESSIQYLRDNGVTIWDEWANETGHLGPVYGVQWRDWIVGSDSDAEHVDQIQEVMEQLKTNPDSRRMIVSAWNVGELPLMALPPCHLLFQLYVADGKLSLQVYQRSADLFLGVPFNITSYALLTHMFAQQAGLEVGELIWVGGDCHVYDNHQNQVREQCKREARPFPQLKLRKASSIFEYTYEDFEITGYDPYPVIKGSVAV